MDETRLEPCLIEQYENGNFGLWLPEQSGLIEWYSQNGSQGTLWCLAIRAVAALDSIDISNSLMEPEGDVLVVYARERSVLERIAKIVRRLIERKTLMIRAFDYVEESGML